MININCLNCNKNLTHIQIIKRNKFCCKGCATSFRQKAHDPNFLEIENDYKYYILGLIFSDGNLNKEETKLSIRTSDKQLSENLYPIFCDLKKRQLYIQKYNNSYKDSFMLVNTNKDAINEIKKFGLEPTKSLTMKFPEIPKKYLFSFIRGYFDGDGSIYISSIIKNKKYYGVSFTSGSKDFLIKLNYLLAQNNIIGHINKDNRKHSNSYYLRIYRKESILELKNLMYKNSQICLERKYNFFVNDIV